jgi:hypothetical protein
MQVIQYAPAIRLNLLVGIAASFEPIFLWARISVQ